MVLFGDEHEERGMTRGERRRRRRRARSTKKRWARRLGGSVVALVVLLAAVAGGAYWYSNYKLSQIHRVSVRRGTLDSVAPGKPFNVLFIGSDSRAFVNNANQASKFGSSSEVGGQRSDVIIIARVVPKTKQVYLLSIPRDTYVDIPGDVQYVSGMNRINAAFNSGPDLLITTLKKDFGISVEHFAEVNFNGFEQMVSSVGGIRIDFPDKLRDYYSGLSIDRTGCQLISGGMALAYVRSRHLYYEVDGGWHYDGMSDWSRIRRQDVFFHALLDQVKKEDLNLLDMNNLLGAVVKNLTVDSSFTDSDLRSLAVEFRDVSNADIHTEVLPTIPYVTSGGADVVLPAPRYDTAMVRKFLAEGTATSPSGPASSSSSAASSSTTTSPPASDVVFDNQPEPWNGTPC